MSLSVCAVPAKVDWAESWWLPRHESKMQDSQNQQYSVVFFGDSIIHKYEDDGIDAWHCFSECHSYLNLGFSGDMTEHLLWRIQNGALDNIEPQKIVIMIGTNNTGLRFDTANESFAGIQAVVENIERLKPSAQIILLALLPRSRHSDHKFRIRNIEINEKLSNWTKTKQDLRYFDFSDMFLQHDHTISKEVMPDALHLSKAGYAILTNALKPILENE